MTFHDEDASSGDYFVAGTPRVNATNRIFGMVRTSDQRTKADFDALAEKIEEKWWDVVTGEKVCFLYLCSRCGVDEVNIDHGGKGQGEATGPGGRELG